MAARQQAIAPISRTDLVTTCSELLEVFTHQTLFIRSIYPADLFERHTWNGILVHKSRHPDLTEYIRGAIHSLQPALVGQALRRFALVVLNADGMPIERHVLDTQLFFDTETVQWNDVSRAMRGLLTKHSLTKLPPLPQGCSFGVVACTPRDAPPSTVNPQLWVEELAGPTGKCDTDLPGTFTLQIVKMVYLAGLARLQLFVERPPEGSL